jgi:hypothetical protein
MPLVTRPAHASSGGAAVGTNGILECKFLSKTRTMLDVYSHVQSVSISNISLLWSHYRGSLYYWEGSAEVQGLGVVTSW